MKYKWDLDKLKKERLSLLKNLILNFNISEEERKTIKTTLEILNNVLEETSSSKLNIELPINYLDKNDILSKHYYKHFSKMNPKILNTAFNLIPFFDEFPPQDITLNTINIPTKEILEITRDFYKSLPKQKYYQEIEKYLDSDNHLLQIDSNHQISYYTGYTVSLFYPKNHSYIIIYKEDTIIDLFTLIHELAHAYFFKYIKAHNLSSPYYYIMEIEGRLFDYLTGNYLIEKGYPKTEIDKSNIILLEDQLEMITSLYLGKIVVDLYNQKETISEENVKNKLENKYSKLIYSFDGLEDALTYSPRDYLKEVISYLTYLDLKEIADHDLEKALYLLENIKKDTNSSIFKTLTKNEITFMKDGYENFQKEIELAKQYKL